MQYDRGADGKLTPLPTQNIDTGSGVERVAVLLQGAALYETDTSHIIRARGLDGTRYADGGERALVRVLADHGRAMTARHRRRDAVEREPRLHPAPHHPPRRPARPRLGLETPFLGALHDVVIEQLGDVHPALAEHRDDVRRLLEAEEQRFAQTLATGSALLDDVIARTRAAGASSSTPTTPSGCTTPTASRSS